MRCASCLFLFASTVSTVFAQPSSEWKKSLPEFDVFVHQSSLVRETGSKGDETVQIWTLRNLQTPIMLSDGKKVWSVKTLNTIYCASRVADARVTAFAELSARGAVVAGPTRSLLEPIEPDTLADALWNNYCKRWWDRFR